MRVLLALLLLAATLPAAPPDTATVMAATVACQTAYRLDDELEEDEAAGHADFPAATAKLRKVLEHAFGADAIRELALFRSRPLDLLAYGVVGRELILVAYRGSRGPDGSDGNPPAPNWGLNRVGSPDPRIPGFAPYPVHPGYAGASRALHRRVESWLRRQLAAHPGKALLLTGHSLGGALAGYGAFHLLGRPDLVALLARPERPPGRVLSFGAAGIAYDPCDPDRPGFSDELARRLAAGRMQAHAGAFRDDAAPVLTRALHPCARRLGAPLEMGFSPVRGPAVDEADVVRVVRGRSAAERHRSVAARLFDMKTHYAFHYVRQATRRHMEAVGAGGFDAKNFREYYGVRLPMRLSLKSSGGSSTR